LNYTQENALVAEAQRVADDCGDLCITGHGAPNSLYIHSHKDMAHPKLKKAIPRDVAYDAMMSGLRDDQNIQYRVCHGLESGAAEETCKALRTLKPKWKGKFKAGKGKVDANTKLLPIPTLNDASDYKYLQPEYLDPAIDQETGHPT
jgi:hypothetical protein